MVAPFGYIRPMALDPRFAAALQNIRVPGGHTAGAGQKDEQLATRSDGAVEIDEMVVVILGNTGIRLAGQHDLQGLRDDKHRRKAEQPEHNHHKSVTRRNH